MDRKDQYIFVLGALEAEGFHNPTEVMEALGMNPTSLVEKAMRCKNDKELRELAEETVRKIKVLQAGYDEGLVKRKKLNQTENQNIKRLAGLIKSNDPKSMEIGQLELEAYVSRKVTEGVCPHALRRKMRECGLE